jgi:hypothetical protein
MNVRIYIFLGLLWSGSLMGVEISDHIWKRMEDYLTTLEHASYCEFYLPMDCEFRYERVRNAIQIMISAHSFQPLKNAWQEIAESANKDLDEITEFSVVIILAYSSVIARLAQTNSATRINWFSLIALYAHLSKIPLHKLFDVLEECWLRYQELIALFPKSEEQTWSEWFHENWWVPTTIIVFTVISFVRWQQQHMSKQELSSFV